MSILPRGQEKPSCVLWQKWNIIYENDNQNSDLLLCIVVLPNNEMYWHCCWAVIGTFHKHWDFLSKVTGSHSNICNGVMGELETFSFKKMLFQTPWWENIWNKAQ